MDRSNHYEAAFAALLQARHVPHIGIDESRRSWLGGGRLKSLDFILPARGAGHWLIDVKGRRWPGGSPERPNRSWQNWATRADVVDSLAWAHSFGPAAAPWFVFAYWITEPQPPPLPAPLWTWHEQRYLFQAIPVADYAAAMKTRSAKWDTVCLPAATFARLTRPLAELVPELGAAADPPGSMDSLLLDRPCHAAPACLAP
ncbi:MAG TPA: HYExAFE family protein [Gemmatales bacterium]|nr:HYExAFE family protein [Gemmatales bacterium]